MHMLPPLKRFLIFTLFLISFVNFSRVAYASEPVPTATLQLSFFSSLFERDTDIIAAILSELPKNFSSFKLNTVGRRLHSTFLYLDNFDQADLRKILELFRRADSRTLQQYGLLRKVTVIDPKKIELSFIGNRSRFLAIRPHPDFIQWQLDFWKFVGDFAPELLQKHLQHIHGDKSALSAEAVHLSLIQWGESFGLILNHQQEQEVLNRMQAVLSRLTASQSFPKVIFDPQKQPLDLVAPPRSISESPLVMLSTRFDKNGAQHNPILRWPRASVDANSAEAPLEVEEFTIPQLAPISRVQLRWIDDNRRSDPEPIADFVKHLPQQFNNFRTELLRTPPSRYPFVVQIGGRSVYAAAESHPHLDPSRAFEIFDRMNDLKIQSLRSDRALVGLSVYASSVRTEFLNPGDYDYMLPALLVVPENVVDFEEARKVAAKIFVTDVLGRFREAIKAGYANLLELRVGSKGTMYPRIGRRSLKAFEDNPFLSEKDLFDGTFVDEFGKVWTLEELVLLEDFVKAKLDIFQNGQRYEASVQFSLAFWWRGQFFSLHSSALKGVSPFLRTAVYQDDVAYAIGLLASRPYEVNQAMKGESLSQAVSEVYERGRMHTQNKFLANAGTDDVFWTAKFIKKFYNLLIYMRRSGFRMDEIFFEQVEDFRKREGAAVSQDVSAVISELLRAVNQTEFKHVSHFRRVLNDLREFNERGQVFTPNQIRLRLQELKNLWSAMEQMVATVNTKPPHRTLLQASIDQLQGLISRVEMASDSERQRLLVLPENREILKNAEYSTYLLESVLLKDPLRATGLRDSTRLWVEDYFLLAPILLLNYFTTRQIPPPTELKWTLIKLGFVNTGFDFAKLRTLVDPEKLNSRADVMNLLQQFYRTQVNGFGNQPVTCSMLFADAI